MEMRVSREIAARPDRVWNIITDVERSPDVLSGVVSVERLDDLDAFGVGTRWRETRVMFGKQATEEMEVTAVDDGHRYTVTADSSGTTYTSVLVVEPLPDERCRLVMTFSAAPGGRVAKVLAATVGRVFLGATRRMLQQDVDDIAMHAEGGTAA